MHEFFRRWLLRRPKCPGVLAWGICFNDGGTASHRFAAEVEEQQLAILWEELADALRQMAVFEADTAQMRWVFGQYVLYAVRRADGISLGVLAERSADESGRTCIERGLAEFRALRATVTAR